MKDLLDEEEYDAFVKNLEEKKQSDEQHKSPLGDLFAGKEDTKPPEDAAKAAHAEAKTETPAPGHQTTAGGDAAAEKK